MTAVAALLLLLLFDPWGPARGVCFARGGASGSTGGHCSGIQRVVEEEMAAAAAAMRVREVRIRLPHFGGTSNLQQSYRGTVGVL
jgi:hypothetical protein